MWAAHPYPAALPNPFFDIAIAVANFEQAFICIPPLEKLGYSYQGEYSIPAATILSAATRTPPTISTCWSITVVSG
jgi:hypothetical protein